MLSSLCYTSLIFPINRAISFVTFNTNGSKSTFSSPFSPSFTNFKSIKRSAVSAFRFSMKIKPAVRVIDRKLIVKDRTILTGVPDNVIETSASASGPVDGIFLGAVFEEESSRHLVNLGTLRDVRFMASFRFKLWWTAQKMGNRGNEIPLETQFLLLESGSGSYVGPEPGTGNVYTVILPLLQGPFRGCLQGGVNDELELCLESGDGDSRTSSFTHAVFIHAGTDPFATVNDAVRAVKLHLKTFRQRHEKKLPGIVDYFGWCTWDAFYQDVTQEGVEAGLESLAAGGTPPRFVIIDDGWQCVAGDPEKQDEKDTKQAPLPRLTGIKENAKFQDKNDRELGIKRIVDIAKKKHGLKYVYVWHAIIGYWGGVRPGVEEMEQFGSLLKYPSASNGVMENDPTWKNDPLAVQGLGLMDPKTAHKFYNELHSYLASAGVDGVKVDVQCILETLGAGHGGRVEITRQYHQALDASIARNFPDNGCIACMSHSTDALYCSKQTAVVRASDDFYPRDPVSHTIHIAAVAYNSVFLGEFMLPDWDMFHSLHPAAEYHASARAISGGPLYVSDAPGRHNFEVLKKLVLPDGSILRAKFPGRPTLDCLFTDPTRDSASLLKIWNMNKYAGVLGVYNCQGAAWNSEARKNTFHQTKTDKITGQVRGRDIHLIPEATVDDPEWTGDCALYCHRSGEVVVLPYNVALPVSLKVLEHEIFTVTPLKKLAPGFKFAPFGLVNMYNSGGAIKHLEYEAKPILEIDGAMEGVVELGNRSKDPVGRVVMNIKGCGKLGFYSSAKPLRCLVRGNKVLFEYDGGSGFVTFSIDEMPEEGETHLVEIEL